MKIKKLKIRAFYLAVLYLICLSLVIPNHSFCTSNFDDENEVQLVSLLDDFSSLSENKWGGMKGIFSKYGATCTPFIVKKTKAHGNTGNSLGLEYNVAQDTSFSGYYSKLNNANLESFNYLSFWIKGDRGREFLRVQLSCIVNGDTIRAKVSVWDYLAGGPTINWQKVMIPLDAFFFLPSRSDVDEMTFVFENYQSKENGSELTGIVYIDNIVFGSYEPGFIKVDHFDDKFSPNALGGNIGVFTEVKGDTGYNYVISDSLFNLSPNGLIAKSDKRSPSSFGGLYFIFGDGKYPNYYDISDYDTLHFAARAIDENTNPVEFKIELRSIVDGDTINAAQIVKDLTNHFKDFEFYLSDFRDLFGQRDYINLEKVGQFNVVFEDWRNQNRDEGIIIFDEIELRVDTYSDDSSLSPPVPDNLIFNGNQIGERIAIINETAITCLMNDDISRLESIRLEYREKTEDIWYTHSRSYAEQSNEFLLDVQKQTLPSGNDLEMRVVAENYNGKQSSSKVFEVIVDDVIFSGASIFRNSFKVFQFLRNEKGVYADAARYDPNQFHPASVATIGIGLISLCIADTLGWILNAEELALETLTAMTGGLPGFNPARNKTGYFRHWINLDTGQQEWNSEFSSIDTGILISGALFCKKYFVQNSEIAKLADSLYFSVDWESAIADPETGGIFLKFDSLGVGEGITYPFNEYMIVAWLAANDVLNYKRALKLWNKHYENPSNLPKSTYQGIEVLTDRAEAFLSDFVIQFPFYLCHHFTINSDYLHYFNNAMLADRQWWRDSTDAPEYIWGFGAGASGFVEHGYNADRIDYHPGTICSPHIIAGFIPVKEDLFIDLIKIYNDSLGIYNLPGIENSEHLWRFSIEDPSWRALDIQGIDFSTMLLGLVSHPKQLGVQFFEYYNNFFDSLTLVTNPQNVCQMIPKKFKLMQNFPNPFNSKTTINFQLPIAVKLRIIVYDILGRKVCTLIDKNVKQGWHNITWDGQDDSGIEVTSGLYLIQMEAGDFFCVKKSLLLK